MAIRAASIWRAVMSPLSIAALVTLAGILGPIVLYLLVTWTGYGRFLFERPNWARIDQPYRRRREAMVPAE